LEECWPCPVFANYTLAFALRLRKKHGKTSVRVAEEIKSIHFKTELKLKEKNVTYCSAQVTDPFRNLDPTGIPPMKLWIYDSDMLFLFRRLPELCESTHQVVAQLLVQFRCVSVCVCVCVCVCVFYKVFNSNITLRVTV
jgi:hypothetical protein